MNQPSQPIWEILQQAGLVQGGAPPTEKLESPWYVKVLLAFSGWLASSFLLGFLVVGFKIILSSSMASAILGSFMIAGAYAILRIPKNEFFEHVALAVSLAGQALIAYGLFDGLTYKDAWIFYALVQVALAIVMPNFVHRVFSSFIATFSFSMFFYTIGASYIFSSILMFVVAWLWLNEFRFPKYIRKIHAIGYGTVLGLIQLKGSALFGFNPIGWQKGEWLTGKTSTGLWAQPWIAEVLAGVVMLYVVWQLLQRLGHRLPEPLVIITMVCTIILSAVSIEAPGITVGMMILLLGFAGSNRVLMGLGIVSLLFYISVYYYLLDATLFAKAQTLLVTGIVLLLIRWAMLKIMRGSAHD